MATQFQSHEGVPEDQLRRKLAAAVRSVQWSYAIFWSSSDRQGGMLEWKNGHYNGDVMTRKTVQPTKLCADQVGLERSKHLRELYLSLSAGDTNQQTKRPSAALSPEDLTDLEWYYLVCMSFTFNPGQGLPGRALANGQHIWLTNADNAETKVFSRSLLAKSASVQTVACFPLTNAVLELGVTELISEETSLIQHIVTTFLEFPITVCVEPSTSSLRKFDDVEEQKLELDHGKLNLLPQGEAQPEVDPSVFPSHQVIMPEEEVENNCAPIGEIQTREGRTGSSEDSSNGCDTNRNSEDSFTPEGLNGVSYVQSWQCMDDDCSNIHSSDCASQSLANFEKAASCKKANDLLLQELQECNHTKLSSLDLETSDSHYRMTLEAVLRCSRRSVMKPSFLSLSSRSCFTSWRKDLDSHKLQICSNTSQKMLKKILFEVARMHSARSHEPEHENGATRECCNFENSHSQWNCVVLERKRREKLNENFLILQSLVPSISKVDKASILGDTIEYLKDLERRVEELEACKECSDSEACVRKKYPDVVERTSDNYGHKVVPNERSSLINKRKASDIDEADAELNWVLSSDGLADMTVSIVDKEVSVEMKCPWRECLLLEIVDALRSLHLDAHTVRSSMTNGILILKLKSKFRGATLVSAGMIKQALQRVMGKF